MDQHIVGYAPTTDPTTIAAVLQAVRRFPAALDVSMQRPPEPGEQGLLRADEAVNRVCGAQLFAKRLVDVWGDVRGAALLHRGLIDEVAGWLPEHPLRAVTLPTMLTTFASHAVDGGQTPELLRCADDWLHELAAQPHRGPLDDLRLRQVEALLLAGHYEQARDALTRVEEEGLRADLLTQRQRLQRKLDGLLSRPDERVVPVDVDAVLADTLAWLREHQSDAAVTRALTGLQAADVDIGSLGMPAFPPAPRSLVSLEDASARLSDVGAPLMALQAVLQGASNVLVAVGRDAGGLTSLQRVADRATAAADRFGYWEEATTAAWIACVTLRRAGRHPEAVARMVALAARIDERRRLIREPRLRAGLAIFQPQLPWALAESAALAGDERAALFGMEVAKSRILADLRPGASAGASSPDMLAAGLTARLRDRPRVHLLAYLVDSGAPPGSAGEPGVRALLRHADGRIWSAEIALGEVAIRAATTKMNDRVRGVGGRRFTNIFEAGVHTRPFDDLLAAMAPLVSWLEPFFADGSLSADDTIVYAADGPIHNLPLAMLPFQGGSFIDSFALVAMPALSLGVVPAPAPAPAQACAVLAPMPDERERGETYQQEIARLQKLLPTRVVSAIEDLPPATADRLLHIAAHGEFVPTTPLRAGGLAMADRDGHYDRHDPRLQLPPESLAALLGTGAHLTMRACLVGRVEQITSREALGAVWAVLAGGAASVVAASWSVFIPSAARWCDYFYAAWLEQGMNRAAAHRHACLTIRAEGGEFAHPVHWAPFVLYAATFEGDIMVDDLSTRIAALSDKQAIHYLNVIASSPEDDSARSDEAFLADVARAVGQVLQDGGTPVPANVSTLFEGGSIANFQAGSAARELLGLMAGSTPTGARIVGAALDGRPDQSADFGTLTGPAVMILGWLLVTGGIRLKIGGFEFVKEGISAKEQVKMGQQFLAALTKFMGSLSN